MQSFSIVVPVYNESENVKNLINEIYLQEFKTFNFEVLFINDGSTDQTLEILKLVSKPSLKIINNDKNYGQSYSIFKGVRNTKYNTIVTMDGDGQNDPKDIQKLLELFFSDKNLYLVGGLRKIRKDSLIKILSSKIANKVRSYILNDNCNDTGCGLKVFEKKIFLSFPYFNGIHRFLPALFTGYGKRTAYVVVNHRYRHYGKSKYKTLERLYKGIFDIIRVKKIINKRKYE